MQKILKWTLNMDLKILKAKTEQLAELCRSVAAASKKIVITGHDMPDCDSIISAVMLKELLLRLGVEAEIKFVTRPDGVTYRLMDELGLMKEIRFDGFNSDDKLVLVDHHVTFYNNEVKGCVDHHTTPPEPDFDFNLIEKASSCGRIVHLMAVSCGVSDDWMEKMAIYSVYFDTQSTRAPKFDQGDIPWLEEGIKRLGLDESELAKKGFCLNSLDEPIEVLAMYAYKRYEFNGAVSASTCIQIDPALDGWDDAIGNIIKFLQDHMSKNGEVMWALVINKPEIMRSDIYFLRGADVEIVKLDRLASRSKDVIPVAMATK